MPRILSEFQTRNNAFYATDQQILDKLKHMLRSAHVQSIRSMWGQFTTLRAIICVGFMVNDDNGKRFYRFSDTIAPETLLELASNQLIEPVFQLDITSFTHTNNVKYQQLCEELTRNPWYFVLSFSALKEFCTKTGQTHAPIHRPTEDLLPELIQTILNRSDVLPRSKRVKLKSEPVNEVDSNARVEQIQQMTESGLLVEPIADDANEAKTRIGPILQRNFSVSLSQPHTDLDSKIVYIQSKNWKEQITGSLKSVHPQSWHELKYCPSLHALVQNEKDDESSLNQSSSSSSSSSRPATHPPAMSGRKKKKRQQLNGGSRLDSESEEDEDDEDDPFNEGARNAFRNSPDLANPNMSRANSLAMEGGMPDTFDNPAEGGFGDDFEPMFSVQELAAAKGKELVAKGKDDESEDESEDELVGHAAKVAAKGKQQDEDDEEDGQEGGNTSRLTPSQEETLRNMVHGSTTPTPNVAEIEEAVMHENDSNGGSSNKSSTGAKKTKKRKKESAVPPSTRVSKRIRKTPQRLVEGK